MDGGVGVGAGGSELLDRVRGRDEVDEERQR
jgi:hypothetical protein